MSIFLNFLWIWEQLLDKNALFKHPYSSSIVFCLRHRINVNFQYAQSFHSKLSMLLTHYLKNSFWRQKNLRILRCVFRAASASCTSRSPSRSWRRCRRSGPRCSQTRTNDKSTFWKINWERERISKTNHQISKHLVRYLDSRVEA